MCMEELCIQFTHHTAYSALDSTQHMKQRKSISKALWLHGICCNLHRERPFRRRVPRLLTPNLISFMPLSQTDMSLHLRSAWYRCLSAYEMRHGRRIGRKRPPPCCAAVNPH